MTKTELLEQWDTLFPNFSVNEIDCNCKKCNHELWDEERYGDTVPEYFIDTIKALQKLRNAWGKTMYINSAHRCIKHNSDPKVGGGRSSWHLRLAFDVVMPSKYQKAFAKMAREHGFRGIGFYPKKNFVHIDMRSKHVEWKG